MVECPALHEEFGVGAGELPQAALVWDVNEQYVVAQFHMDTEETVNESVGTKCPTHCGRLCRSTLKSLSIIDRSKEIRSEVNESVGTKCPTHCGRLCRSTLKSLSIIDRSKEIRSELGRKKSKDGDIRGSNWLICDIWVLRVDGVSGSGEAGREISLLSWVDNHSRVSLMLKRLFSSKASRRTRPRVSHRTG